MEHLTRATAYILDELREHLRCLVMQIHPQMYRAIADC